jgi:hypothetical protein
MVDAMGPGLTLKGAPLSGVAHLATEWLVKEKCGDCIRHSRDVAFGDGETGHSVVDGLAEAGFRRDDGGFSTKRSFDHRNAKALKISIRHLPAGHRKHVAEVQKLHKSVLVDAAEKVHMVRDA